MIECRRVITGIGMVVALGGCVMGPDYSRPQIETPQAFRYEDKSARELADDEWWKQFGDPVLEGFIAEALAHNKEVQIAAANVESASAIITQTRAALFPQVGYQGAAIGQRLSERNDTPLPPTVPNPQDAYQALAGVSWELDLWGRIRRLSEAARANALATEEARRGVILSLVASVANTYIQLRAFDRQLEIAKRTLANYEEALRFFELQFRYGQVAQLTVEQARSQREFAAAAIPQIERDIALGENALSVLLGRNPDQIARGKTLVDLARPRIPAGVPSQVLERRPDIAEAEQRLIAANARIGAARAQYFPTISLTGAYGSASGDLSDLFSGPAEIWTFAGSITGPIFTGGLIAGEVAQAEAEQQAALVNYQAVIQRAFADVENALVSRQKFVAQVDAEARRVTALTEYARLARQQYDGGYTSYLTVLDAQQKLFPAELSYAQNLGLVHTALVNVYKAMGGGWVDKADTLAPQPSAPGNALAAPLPRHANSTPP